MNPYSLLAHGRAEDALPSLVQLGHDDVLCLVGARLRGEVDDVGFVHVAIELLEQEFLHNTASHLSLKYYDEMHQKLASAISVYQSVVDPRPIHIYNEQISILNMNRRI